MTFKSKARNPKIKSPYVLTAAFASQTEKQSQKSKAPTGQVEAFDWDGMGGNIGGLFVYVLALVIMYYLLVDLQWIESELPVTHKVAPKQPIFDSKTQKITGK